MTATATPRRVNMRDRVKIGQRWQRNRGKEIAVIRQIHRADRQVELIGVAGVRLVSFTDLRKYWTELRTVGSNEPTGQGVMPPALPVAPNTTVHTACSGTAGTTSGRFKPPAPARDFERGLGTSDLQMFMENPIRKETAVPLPQTKTSREGRDPRDARVLLVAPPKTGKTTLAAAWAPDTTLILDTHQGTRLLDGEHYVQPVQTFKDFETAVDQIAAGGHEFRTVIVDLVEHVYKMAEDQAADKFGQVAAAIVEYGKGTGYAEAVFRRTVDKLLAAPIGVWFLSHVETIQDGSQITYIPKIDKRVRTYIEGATDFCLLAEIKGTTRQLQTAPSARYQIGCRVPLPNPMPLDARALYVEIAKGLAKPKPAAPAAPAPVQTQQPKEPIAA